MKFSHSLFTRNKSETLLAVSFDSGAKGYGEGTPRPYVTGETWAQTVSAAKKLALACKGKKFHKWNDLRSFLLQMARSKVAREAPSAWCAVELSILDLWAKQNQVPLWRLFVSSPASTCFYYSASLPILSPDKLKHILAMIKGLGIYRVKLKAKNIEQGIQALSLARKFLGPHAEIRVDANGAFDLEVALEFLEGAKDFSITAIEQPVDKYDLSSFKIITESGGTTTIADESMFATEEPVSLLDDGVCHGLNIRLSSSGGFLKSLSLARKVIDRDGILQLGGHVGETSILSAAARHLAAVVGHVKFLEGSASKYLLSFDISKQDISFGDKGYAPLLNSPGLGIEIVEQRLSQIARPIYL